MVTGGAAGMDAVAGGGGGGEPQSSGYLAAALMSTAAGSVWNIPTVTLTRVGESELWTLDTCRRLLHRGWTRDRALLVCWFNTSGETSL